MIRSTWGRVQDWLALAACLVASLVVLFTRNEPVMVGLRAQSLGATAWVESKMSWAGRFFGALGENDRLRLENIELAAEVARARESVQENTRLRDMLGFRDTLGVPLKLARIVGKDLGQQQNFFTIDAGTDDSVRVGMAVVDERGILGKVVLVSSRYARVMAYLNTDFRVPVRVLPVGAEGIARWDGRRPDRLVLDQVSRTEPVRQGMLVVTSGISSVFTPGFPVGTVEEVEARAGQNALTIGLSPAAAINRARFCFVVLRERDPSLVSLEGSFD